VVRLQGVHHLAEHGAGGGVVVLVDQRDELLAGRLLPVVERLFERPLLDAVAVQVYIPGGRQSRERAGLVVHVLDLERCVCLLIHPHVVYPSTRAPGW
jgi:hypothetical protein